MLPLYPRVPHFLGSNAAPDDLVMTEEEQVGLLGAEVCVFEKLDGINTALGLHRGQVVCELRPPWDRALGGAVARALDIYVRQREAQIASLLKGGQVAYGEWLWHRVSVSYGALPDLLVMFGLRAAGGRFLLPAQLQHVCARVGLTGAPPIFEGRLGSVARLRRLAGRSRYGAARGEGLVVEQARRGTGVSCAKWVGSRYRHVRPGTLSGARNQLAPGALQSPAMEELLGQRLVIVTLLVDEAGREIAGGASERCYGKIVGVAGGLVTVELDDGAQQVINTREIPIAPLDRQARHYLGPGRRRARPRFIAKEKKLFALDP